jgi:putative alpha-1,2-mannosidase
MGFYPVAPATDQYVLGAPLFKKVTMKLQNGKQVVITAPENSQANKYIQQMRFNGKNYGKNWLSHQELMQGARIEVKMTDTPNKKRGVNKSDFPYSLSNE